MIKNYRHHQTKYEQLHLFLQKICKKERKKDKGSCRTANADSFETDFKLNTSAIYRNGCKTSVLLVLLILIEFSSQFPHFLQFTLFSWKEGCCRSTLPILSLHLLSWFWEKYRVLYLISTFQFCWRPIKLNKTDFRTTNIIQS